MDSQKPFVKKIMPFVVGLFVAILIFSLAFRESVNLDIPPYDADALVPDYSKSVVLWGGEDLFPLIGSFNSYDSLREDLFVFGKLAYEPYKTNLIKNVGFEIDKKSLKKELKTISFKGRYGSSKNKIQVIVSLLNNRKIKTSIVDTKTSQNFDNDLPSNNSFHQFIGTLPLDTDNYSISYSIDNSKIVIRLNRNEITFKDEALLFLKEKVGSKYINEKNIAIFYPVQVGVGDEGKFDWVQLPIGVIIENF